MSIQTYEELSINAWPAFQTNLLDGWVLRFAGGYTRRANSVSPLYPGRRPLPDKIDEVEALYAAQGLPAIFKLAGRDDPATQALDAVLSARGYRPNADTFLQTLDLAGWTPAGEPDAAVLLDPNLTPAWQATFQALDELDDAHMALHTRILTSILPQTAYVLIHLEGRPAGCALGVLQSGCLGIYDVVVDPQARGQGLGGRLLTALFAWARPLGAHTAYLQVMQNNPPALRLYQRLGFRTLYEYWYRSPA